MADDSSPAEKPNVPVLSEARRAAAWFLDRLLPPQCPVCRTVVDAPHTLCVSCFNRLDFISPPFCDCCGLPFAYDQDAPHTQRSQDALLCGNCIVERPSYRRARSVLRYGNLSGLLAIRFKHYDRADLAVTFAGWMAAVGQPLLETTHLIVPVPLHRRRLMQRMYNQSALLAQAIAKQSDKTWQPDLLVRVRHTPPQTKLGRTGRKANVVNAFAVSPKYRALVPNRTILLVDDVLTTGATVNHCAKALLAAGAEAVDVLTLARVSDDD